MNEIKKDAYNKNQDMIEMKAFYEQKILELETLI